jgi:phosphomannomutase/phosphoglucomutase
MRVAGYAALGLAAYSVFLIATIPAAYVGAQLQAAYPGRIEVSDAKGTVWRGEARLRLAPARGTSIALDRVDWRMAPTRLLAGELAYDATAAAAGLEATAQVARGFSAWHVRGTKAAGDASSFATVVPLIAAWRPTGAMTLTAPEITIAGNDIRGSLDAQWRDAGIGLSDVRPLGTYRVAWHASNGPGRIEVTTLRGPLQVTGKGTTTGLRFAFSGEARGEGESAKALEPLLDLMGPAPPGRRARPRASPRLMAKPAFVPARWLPGAHLQTIYASLFARAPQVEYRRERWDTPDGDFVDVDFVDGLEDAPSVHLFHGLEGSSRSHYARVLMHAVRSRGWRGTVLNFRGCSGEPNRLARAYHSGDSEEVNWVLRRMKERLGAATALRRGRLARRNALLKWLGEHGEDATRVADAAAAISAPMDLMAGGDALGAASRSSMRAISSPLCAKNRATSPERFPGLGRPRPWSRARRPLREFDNAFTAPGCTASRYRRLLDAFLRPSPGFPRSASRTLVINAPRRPLHAESAAAHGTRGRRRGHVRIHAERRPCRVRERVLPRAHRLAAVPPPAFLRASRMNPSIPPEIFKAYDIRGIVDRTLTESGVETIGRALGTYAARKNVKKFVVGRDGRLSGPRLVAALTRGLNAAGMDVIDIGVVATPMVYFGTFHFDTGSGVMVTGSHNPPDYNGLKMMVAGDTLAGESVQDLRKLIDSNGLVTPAQAGAQSTADVTEAYLERITSDVKLARPMTIAVDCGNGSPGAVAPLLFRKLGCKVIELFCEVDGHFPQSPPRPGETREPRGPDREPAHERRGNRPRLRRRRRPPRRRHEDRQDHLPRPPAHALREGSSLAQSRAEVIFDVKSTRNLFSWIRKHGGRPLLWKTGHSLLKAKLKETGAPLAGEMSGHVFFKDRWYGFDDGLYAGAGSSRSSRRRRTSPRRSTRFPIRSAPRSCRSRSSAKATTIASSRSCATRRNSRAPPKSSRSTGCASSTRTASGSCAHRTRRPSSCCASRPTTRLRSRASSATSSACSPSPSPTPHSRTDGLKHEGHEEHEVEESDRVIGISFEHARPFATVFLRVLRVLRVSFPA